ncbi:MAG: hypothetical protein P8L85_14615 [Rubripirellula sp.]|nr:hypothetical protein [Rubripirellula sp.]
MMILPLAAVIRCSGQALADVNEFGSTSEKMRHGLRYVSELIRAGNISKFSEKEITIVFTSGQPAIVRLRLGRLEVRQGGVNLKLVTNVQQLKFIERKQSADPGLRSGIEIQMIATDPTMSHDVLIKTAVAIPPQI